MTAVPPTTEILFESQGKYSKTGPYHYKSDDCCTSEDEQSQTAGTMVARISIKTRIETESAYHALLLSINCGIASCPLHLTDINC